MPKSAVVDASVLVSAFLFPASVPGRVLRLAHQGKFVLHLAPLLLDETRYALLSTRLRDVYHHDDQAVLAWCAKLEEVGRLFAAPLPEIGPVCRDPDDDRVIATALAVLALMIRQPLSAVFDHQGRHLGEADAFNVRRLQGPDPTPRWSPSMSPKTRSNGLRPQHRPACGVLRRPAPANIIHQEYSGTSPFG
jgi:putative PIN family toxin of toxin-antitoxin system